jgi:hypothetical protein
MKWLDSRRRSKCRRSPTSQRPSTPPKTENSPPPAPPSTPLPNNPAPQHPSPSTPPLQVSPNAANPALPNSHSSHRYRIRIGALVLNRVRGRRVVVVVVGYRRILNCRVVRYRVCRMIRGRLRVWSGRSLMILISTSTPQTGPKPPKKQSPKSNSKPNNPSQHKNSNQRPHLPQPPITSCT